MTMERSASSLSPGGRMWHWFSAAERRMLRCGGVEFE